MHISLVAFALAAGAPVLVAAQSTFLTTSPYVNVFCGVKGDQCGAAGRVTQTLGYYIVTEAQGPAGATPLGSLPCPVITTTRQYGACLSNFCSSADPLGPVEPSGCPGPMLASVAMSATASATASTSMSTGRMSVTSVPKVSMSLFHNAAVTPGPQLALAAAGVAGLAAAMI